MSPHSFQPVGRPYNADEDKREPALFHEPRIEERRDDEKYCYIAQERDG